MSSKTVDIHDCIVENDLDVFVVTETWLKEKGDELVITDMTPPGYNFVLINTDDGEKAHAKYIGRQ